MPFVDPDKNTPSVRKAWQGPKAGFLMGGACLCLVLLPAAALRVVHLDYGLPQVLHPDEKSILVPALRIADVSQLNLDPDFFNYPSLDIYVLAASFYLEGISHSAGSFDRPVLPDLVQAAMLARWLTTLFGLATVALAYVAGRLVASRLAGLLAALLLALTPLHALDSHYANVDVPLTFFCLLSFCLAVKFVKSGRLAWFFAAAAAIGCAGATKYSGAAMVFVLPAALFLSRVHLRRGAWLLAAGASVCLGCFLVCAPYTILRFEDFLEALRFEHTHVQQGHWGWDLEPGRLLNHRFIYQLGAGLPLCLGFALYLMSLWGLVRMACRPVKDWLLPAAALCPMFLLAGSSRVVFPRYLLPLLPFLVLCASLALEGMLAGGRTRRVRTVGLFLLAGTLAYTSALTVSQLRILKPQNAAQASRWIVENVPAGSRIAVAATTWTLTVPQDRYRVELFNLHQAVRPGEAPEWLVVSGWYETALERGNLAETPAGRFFAELGSPGHPYALEKAFRSRYFNEAFYGWLDPYFKNQFESPDFAVYRARSGMP